jgi:hypothetical protein
MKDFNLKFLEPDSNWKELGIKNQKDYLDKIYIEGRFHKNVPDVIKMDFKLVESLIFYSYFNYRLIDEAFGKATRNFESSVDIRMDELNLERQKGFESLKSKIDRLQKYYSTELTNQYKVLKELRNTFAHHKAGRLLGITVVNGFIHVINMINSLFLSKIQIEHKERLLKKLTIESSHLRKGTFILENAENRYLIWSAVPQTCWKSDDKNLKSFWVFHPIVAASEITDINHFPEPFYYNLKDLEIYDSGMKGVNLESGGIITMTATDNEDNINYYKKHFQLMRKTDLELKQMYAHLLQQNIGKRVSKFLYKEAW